MKASLTVFFEDPFWVGVFERIEDGKLSVCKVTFGAEPKDYEGWDYILHHYYELVFSPAVEMEIRQAADNPKRRRKRRRKRGADKLYISAHSSKESQAAYRALGCTPAEEVNEGLAAAEPYDVQMEYKL